MKKLLIFQVVLLLCLSCSNNTSLSDSKKEKIIAEVKQVNDSIKNYACKGDFATIFEKYAINSPDYIYTGNGQSSVYADIEGTEFNVISQDYTLINEKYAVLSPDIVLYTNNATWLMHMKDGSEIMQDPWVTHFTFKKTDGKWKVIAIHESGVNHLRKGATTARKLNQEELLGQFAGKWVCKFNDTIVYIDQKPYGKHGQESTYRMVYKGKTFDEGKQVLYYDAGWDKIVMASLDKNGSNVTSSITFKDKTNYEFVFNEDAFHPETAIIVGKGEFTSADQYVETIMNKDKPVRTYTFTRVR